MEPLVTAVVLNYNSGNECEKCVKSLAEQDYDNLNILVIDNNSTKEDERNILAKIEKKYNVKIILNNVNGGFSAGNNIGLKQAVKDGAVWCLVINPDVVIDSRQYIKEMIKRITEYSLAVVAASKMILPSGERQNPYCEISYSGELLWFLDAIKLRYGKSKGYLLPDETGYCPKVSGCCFFIKSEFLLEIGFLDENVFLYCEEPILASQVRQHGYRELYVSEIQAYHNHVPSQKGSTRKRMQNLLTSRIYYLKRYSGYRGIKLFMVLNSKRLQKLFWKIRGE